MGLLSKDWGRKDRDLYLKKCKRLMKKTQKVYSNELLDSLDSMSERERQLFIDCWDLLKESMNYVEFSIKQLDRIEDQNVEIISMLHDTQKMIKERGH